MGNLEHLSSLFFEYPTEAQVSVKDGAECFAEVAYRGKRASGKASGSAQTRKLRAVYKACEKLSGITPPWGILTGIRPDFVFGMLLSQGLDRESARQTMINDYLVTESKTLLMERTAMCRERLGSKPGEISVYIGIPFCPTRCAYCSFISHDAVSMRGLEDSYLQCLCREIKETSSIVQSLGLRIRSVYIGGGTPTSLKEENLAVLMREAEALYSDAEELCVEGGRPDTLTKEKLETLKAAGTGRICINPQTAKNETLRRIGRAHTWEDFREKYGLARELGFDNINCDLIAGLDGETAEDFEKSIDSLLSLDPDGVTVHALYVKRGSRAGGGIVPYDAQAEKMVNVAREKCEAYGLYPYYLYRQKKTVSNLENVGYAKTGKECIFNIDTIGDRTGVVALGAGGVTKLTDGVRTERYANFKNADLYIKEFDEIINRKNRIRMFYSGRYV